MAQQTLWEAMKQEAQSAFNQIGTAYQDILIHSRLMAHGSGMDRQNAMNMEIAEAGYKEPEQGEELFYLNHFPDADHRPPEPQLEPEM